MGRLIACVISLGAGHPVRAGQLPGGQPRGPGPLAAPVHQPHLPVGPAAAVPGRQLARLQVRGAYGIEYRTEDRHRFRS